MVKATSDPQPDVWRLGFWLGLAAAFATLTAPADAATIGMVAGSGDGVSRIAATLRTRDLWRREGGSRAAYSLAAEWGLSYWKAEDPGRFATSIIDGSVTSVLAATFTASRDLLCYLETGFGIHLLSREHIDPDRELGANFQFGEFIGGGVRFGAERQYSLGARIQHVSNGGIASQNDGITFVQLMLSRRW
jgi:hypothetical protein